MPAKKEDVAEIHGLKAGTPVPNVKVKTLDGKSRKFTDLTGSKGVVVAFVRSLDWCPFCKKQIREQVIFSVHFDQVHSDFLKRLGEQFPNLSPNDYKLSAYLKMNLSTKEIASLMNISVRGVEASRYRLRKRLNLESSVNLTEFLMKL